MATNSPPPLSSKKKKSNKRKRIPRDPQQLEKLDSLRWNPSLSLDHNDNDHDPFSLLVGSTELDGGFLSLEEIDEADYELQIPKPEKGKVEKKSKSKKQKHGGDDDDEDFCNGVDDGSEEMMEEEKDVKSEKKKKKKKKKKAKKQEKSEQIEERVAG